MARHLPPFQKSTMASPRAIAVMLNASQMPSRPNELDHQAARGIRIAVSVVLAYTIPGLGSEGPRPAHRQEVLAYCSGEP